MMRRRSAPNCNPVRPIGVEDHSQATPSPSRSRWRPYPASPARIGAAPAALAAAQFRKLVARLAKFLRDGLERLEPEPVAEVALPRWQ